MFNQGRFPAHLFKIGIYDNPMGNLNEFGLTIPLKRTNLLALKEDAISLQVTHFLDHL